MKSFPRFLFLIMLSVIILSCLLERSMMPAHARMLHTSDDTPNVTYHGGPVIDGIMNLYYIFLVPSDQPDDPAYQAYKDEIIQFTHDASSVPFYHDLEAQYTDLNDRAPTGFVLQKAITVPEETPLDDAGVDMFIKQFQDQNSLPRYDQHNMYVIFATASDNDYMGDACGFHSAAIHRHAGQILVRPFSVIGFPRHGCIPPESPNGAVDGSINVLFHELFEGAADPAPETGWLDSTTLDHQGEIGDLCARTFGLMHATGGNVEWNGHPYVLQTIWSNQANSGTGGCVLG